MTNRGTKLFFRRIKYCWRKRDERVAVHCSLFAVNFSTVDDFFFGEKVLCVCRGDRYLDANPAYGIWQKTCSRNMANAFYRLFAVRCFFVISPLFCCCSRIVYSGLHYQQLSGEKKGGNVSESGVEISKFVFHILQSYLRDWPEFQVVMRFNQLVGIID